MTTMQQGAFLFTPKVSGLSKNDPVLLLVRRLAMIAANYARTHLRLRVNSCVHRTFLFYNDLPVPAAEFWEFQQYFGLR